MSEDLAMASMSSDLFTVIPLSLLLRKLQKPLQLVLYQAVCAWSSNCENISETFHTQTWCRNPVYSSKLNLFHEANKMGPKNKSTIQHYFQLVNH